MKNAVRFLYIFVYIVHSILFLIYKVIFLVIFQNPEKDLSPVLRPLSQELGKRQKNCKMKFKYFSSNEWSF